MLTTESRTGYEICRNKTWRQYDEFFAAKALCDLDLVVVTVKAPHKNILYASHEFVFCQHGSTQLGRS